MQNWKTWLFVIQSIEIDSTKYLEDSSWDKHLNLLGQTPTHSGTILFLLNDTWFIIYSKSRPFCLHMDDIWFRAPVEIGSLLYFNSQICYTQDNFIQTRVSAEESFSNIKGFLPIILILGCKSKDWWIAGNKCFSFYFYDKE